jgi:membrane-bound lytic murein transglycosylase A
MRSVWIRWGAGLLCLVLAACGTASHRAPDKLTLAPTSYGAMPGWDEDNHIEALVTFLKSCSVFSQMADNDATGRGTLLAPTSVWKALCRKAQLLPLGVTAGQPGILPGIPVNTAANEALARQFFETNFIPFGAGNNNNPGGLLTGYYEPLLTGSRTQVRPYVYPVYGAPAPGTPSYTRSQIDLGILKGQAPILAYVDDPVQLFFLHIQGSGRIQLDTGQVIRIGYGGTNRQPYVAIGKVLVEKGLMKREDVTMPSLKQWLYDHPADMWQVMWENPSYVFFRETVGDAIGSQKVPLTPMRSLAVDANYVPLGMPVFIDTMLPQTPSSPIAIERRLYIAQDTGGAIKGPVRGDIFFGSGQTAEELAGRMKSGGAFTFLVPRSLAMAMMKPPAE